MKNSMNAKRIVVFAAVMFSLGRFSVLWAGDLYVDVNRGDDSGAGTRAEPFRTLQHAAAEMVPGDVCYIREGVYRETLVPAVDQLTFRNYEDEVVLVTGLDIVDGWVPYGRGIWKARFVRKVPEPFKASMVFVDGRRMNWARYPNEDGDMLNNRDTRWVVAGADSSSGSEILGTVVFDELPAPEKNAWQGAYFVGLASYNTGAWFTANKGLVEASDGNSLVVKNISWNWMNGAKKGRFLGEGFGYLIGHLQALDAETEWHLQDDTLYLFPPEGTDMKSACLEARSRILGLDLSGRTGIRIEGIHFKAAGVKMDASVDCVLDRCSFRYASGFSAFHANAWGDSANGDAGIYVSGNRNTVKNCYIGKTWGNGIAMWGDHNTLENCIVEHCNWQAERLANVFSPGDDNVIRGNTIRYGAREGIELGNTGWIGKYARRALVQYNHVHHLGMLCPDGGLLYVNHQGGNMPVANTEISYNIWHDYPNADFPRPHGGIYLDNMSSGYRIHHNVIWNVLAGIHLNDLSKTNNTHDVYIHHNTIINCRYAVHHNQGRGGSLNARDIVVQNNRSNGAVFEGTQVDHNRTAMQDSKFVDPGRRNYRLKKRSPSIDAGVVVPGINDDSVGAPDLGAYEYGGPDWTAGASIDVPDFPDEKKPPASSADPAF